MGGFVAIRFKGAGDSARGRPPSFKPVGRVRPVTCGRFSLFAPRDDVEEALDATFASAHEPRYNAAPGQPLPVVTNEDPDVVQRMEWGLVPSWADDRSNFGFVNARAETVSEEASFRDAAER